GITPNGSVWAWGINVSGQLGDGTTTNRHTPVRVSGLSGATAVAGGNGHSLALKSDGTVFAWGTNDAGQLGDGTTIERHTPVQVSGLSGIVAIAAGRYSSMALKADGTVFTWGNTTYLALGCAPAADPTTPVQVNGLSGIVAVAAGERDMLALRSDGTVFAWGKNSNGELGDGTTHERCAPVQVNGLTNVTSIAMGRMYSLALTSDGTIFTWGDNVDGQLGDGTTIDRHEPIVSNFDGGATWPMPNPVSTGLPNPASYTNLIGSVLDNVTGLVWEQPALGCSAGCSQAAAATYCDNLTLGGFSDWRLPTRIELVSIVDDTQHFSALDPNAFPGASNGYYKTSTPVVGLNDTFTVGGAEGDTSNRNVSTLDGVRCVRGVVSASADHYTIPGDGTVVDPGTGLTWQQAVPSKVYSFDDAISYCNDNMAGLPGNGWRLPSMKELQTLVDASLVNPAIDTNAFPNTPIDVSYWTSTPVAWQPGHAWNVFFNIGQSNHAAMGSGTYHIRCVR
ncbi:MAG TPA: DUF1566 domain-containing protein, partial [Polyangium sp.]|nr:DUF1566 domain-containing protein [Polyangium sp.]